ncbi:MAG: ATP-binding protein [Firmicutes bacterium]|nr:ATP-binding protein [Bacillota bacterium]
MERESQAACQICQGRGVLLEDTPGGLVTRPCRCQLERIKQMHREQAGIGQKRYEGMTLKNFKPRNPHQKKALQGVADYVKNYDRIKGMKSNSVLLVGDVGVGKTHLLVGAARALIDKGVPVVFASTVELIENLREAELNKTNPEYDGESIHTQVETLSRAEVVFFDDIGKEKISEWVQVQYYRIINRRYLAMLPTLFSTNLGKEELKQAVGETVASRMAEMSAGRIYVVLGEDIRYENTNGYMAGPGSE